MSRKRQISHKLYQTTQYLASSELHPKDTTQSADLKDALAVQKSREIKTAIQKHVWVVTEITLSEFTLT